MQTSFREKVKRQVVIAYTYIHFPLNLVQTAQSLNYTPELFMVCVNESLDS